MKTAKQPAKRAALRVTASGLGYERWDNFAEEWYALPHYWPLHEAKEFVARIVGVEPKDVRLEPRPKA